MDGESILRMEDITVEFPGVLALNKVDFEAKKGEVHVLLGENGAGKSTIMKVLAGVNTHYTGTITWKGKEIISRDVNEQRARGISIIFQETNLFGNLTAAENIFMGRQPHTKTGNVDWKKMNSDARNLLDSLNAQNISEKACISSLSVGQMQMVEIAKALSFESEIIIMDEPTSALTEKEVDSLFETITQLKERGVTIVYISHRLEEILRIGDRITILRDGENVATLLANDTTVDEMIKLMVGRELSEQFPKLYIPAGETVLEVKNVTRKGILKDVSFYARKGEILGFYGLMGAGRTELMRAVFGADKIDCGEVYINSKPVKIGKCSKATENGMAFLTEDRKNQGLILSFSVMDNMALVNLDVGMKWYGLSNRDIAKRCDKLISALQVKTPSLKQKVRNLSGGNQQKVVIAKWLNADSDIIIFDEPTRGIDVGAKVEIYKIMNNLKQRGKVVIMVTSELPEALGISDRMYVMYDGRITKCFDDVEGLSEDDVLKYAASGE